jgi:predicted amidohydrolase YtcJ
MLIIKNGDPSGSIHRHLVDTTIDRQRKKRQLWSTPCPLLGAAREPHHFPFGSLARSGARLAMGSDWPVTSPHPLWGLHSAVHRTAPRDDPHADDRARTVPLVRAQRLSLFDALRAYTSGSAHANHLDQTGRIAEGRLADLVLVDHDLTDPDALEHATVVMTLVDGVPVHEKAPGITF